MTLSESAAPKSKVFNENLTGFFITSLIFLIIPVFIAMKWFNNVSGSIDAAEAAAKFRSDFIFFGEIWVVITISFALCLGAIYFSIRSIKHKNYWVRNFSLMIILLGIFFALLDLKWLFIG